MDEATTLSKRILDLGNLIEEKSGATINFADGTTSPEEQWIPKADIYATEGIITLRTAEQVQQTDGIVNLQQFNPNFFLAKTDKNFCRVPGCPKTTPRLKSATKEDLFMCEIHRKEMVDLVSKRCEKEDTESEDGENEDGAAAFKHEDFKGYTFLIGALEKVFMHLMKKPATLNLPKSSNLLLAEVFLNTRNFLIITNALLNPNDENLDVVLAQFLAVFERILRCLELLVRLAEVIRDIMNIIQQHFGIIYRWEYLHGGVRLPVGAGRLMGGVLLQVGVVVVSVCLANPRIFIAGSVSFVAGYLVAGGNFAWHTQPHETDQGIRGERIPPNQRIQEYQQFVHEVPRRVLYHAIANRDGGIELEIRNP